MGEVEQFDSILSRLRVNIKNHTQSFYEPAKGLDDSLIHNYDWNEALNKDYNENLMSRRMSKQERKKCWGSMIIHAGDEEGEDAEGDMENILDFSF